MNYLVKNAQGEILKLTVVSGIPQLPEGFELLGLESEINPLNLDHAIASLQIVEVEPARQELVSAEVLAVPEVLYQAAVLDTDGNVVTPEVFAQLAIPYQAAVYNNVPAVMGPRMVEDVVKKALDTKSALITIAYEKMNKDILDQMAVVFGTTNPDSANANKQSWDLMEAEPALFVPSKFATTAEVVAFASAKVAAVKNYAVWREAQIDAFRAYKAGL